VNDPDVTEFVAVGMATVEVKIAAPEQFASFGPYSVKVTVPPACGLTRPLTVALSVMALPSVIGVMAWVVIVGVAGVTTDSSLASLHAPVTGALGTWPGSGVRGSWPTSCRSSTRRRRRSRHRPRRRRTSAER
jgi:hypothetical protein